MINIEKIRFKNFLSYGDEETIIDLNNLSQCFITGDNGAGKSSITQAMLWCLSGSTMHKKNPGDSIMNWYSKNDCMASLTFTDGSELTRIRKQGHTELIYNKDGQNVIEDTLSTTKNQQIAINKLLKFDLDIFCGSVFLSQSRKNWLSMGDQTRRQLLERIMGIDRLNYYAEIAKEKVNEHIAQKDRLINMNADKIKLLNDMESELLDAKNDKDAYVLKMMNETKAKNDEIKIIEEQLNLLPIINIKEIEAKWNIINKINDKINDIKNQIALKEKEINDYKLNKSEKQIQIDRKIADCKNKIAEFQEKCRTIINKYESELNVKLQELNNNYQSDVNTHKQIISDNALKSVKINTELNSNRNQLNKWKNKDNTCIECEQPIDQNYVQNKIKSYDQTIYVLEKQLNELNFQSESENDIIISLTKTFDDHREKLQTEYETKKNSITTKRNEGIQLLESEIVNLNDQPIETNNNEVKKLELELEKLSENYVNIISKVKENTPEYTVSEAKSKLELKESLTNRIKSLNEEIIKSNSNSNPFDSIINKINKRITNFKENNKKIEEELSIIDYHTDHINYIYKAYSDRRKIKSFLTKRYKPYFNSRLEHYLKCFELDINISINDALGIGSDLWGHEFQSGGEKTRSELAFVFAVFDLYHDVHGSQCNVLVMDEPDDGLDESGIQSLINIINNELVYKFSTIFIISHRQAFRDVFPNSILVERNNRLSKVVEVR